MAPVALQFYALMLPLAIPVLVAAAAEESAEDADMAADEVGVTSIEVEAAESVTAADPLTLWAALLPPDVADATAEEAPLAAEEMAEETAEDAWRLFRGEATTAEAPSARRAPFLMNILRLLQRCDREGVETRERHDRSAAMLSVN